MDGLSSTDTTGQVDDVIEIIPMDEYDSHKVYT